MKMFFQKISENKFPRKYFSVFAFSPPELMLFHYTKCPWRTWGGTGAGKRAKSLNSAQSHEKHHFREISVFHPIPRRFATSAET